MEKGSDLEALKFHLEDLVDEEEEGQGQTRVWGGMREVELGKMK